MKIAIIGSGLSSMYAIMACNRYEIKPHLFIRDIKIQPGAFWLKFLPTIWNLKFEQAKTKISISFKGSVEEYIEKNWKDSDLPDFYSSSFPNSLNYFETGFNPEEIYLEFMSKYGMFEGHDLLENLSDLDIATMCEKFDLIFYSFASERCRLLNSKLIGKKLCIKIKSNDRINNWVLYDGDPYSYFVRISNLFGFKYLELKDGSLSADALNQILVMSGVNSTVICFDDLKPSVEINPYPPCSNAIPIGRMGTMQYRTMAHDAYEIVLKEIENVFGT